MATRILDQKLAANLTPQEFSDDWRNRVSKLPMLASVRSNHLVVVGERLEAVEFPNRKVPAPPVERSSRWARLSLDGPSWSILGQL